jgi:hypothetical protein
MTQLSTTDTDNDLLTFAGYLFEDFLMSEVIRLKTAYVKRAHNVGSSLLGIALAAL